MPVQLVTDGRDPLTAPVLAYLEQLGVPAALIRGITLHSTLNDFQRVTVELLVDRDAVQAAPRVVPLLDVPMRDEHPRTDQSTRATPLHRTCGNYHPPFTECPPGQPAPGSDGDTRDWPTDTIPAVSHAPNVCVCGEPIVYRQTPDRSAAWWGHMDADVPLDHTCIPR
jgi:hypothetical protein